MAFALEDLCFIDCETRAVPGTGKTDGDVTQCGTFRYAQNARPIMVTYCIGTGPVQIVCKDDWGGDPAGGFLTMADMPDDLRAFWRDTNTGDQRKFVAFNAGFDRELLSTMGSLMRPRAIVDAMAQAVASQLPPSLQGASRAIGRGGKQADGKELITLFCRGNGALPEHHPTEWERFKSYGLQDTEELREVWQATFPLSRAEWEEYWAGEEINARGMPVDLHFVRAAAEWADVSRAHINRQIAGLTGGVIDAVTQVQRLTHWVHDNISFSEAREIMTKQVDEDSETGERTVQLGLDRDRIQKLMALLEHADDDAGLSDTDWAIYQALELRLYGGSSAPGKFSKMLDQHADGLLKGQYVFNGASQTGRFSSRGVQIHNMTRSTLGENMEPVVMDYLQDHAPTPERVEAFEEEFGVPISRALSLLIRPSFIAPDGYSMVWGDWSAIEARILPWLADSPTSRKVLDVFEGNDNDPGKPDIYMIEAANLHELDAQDCWDRYRDGDKRAKGLRQEGKVSVLSLGFGGSVGALQAMAANYGVYYDEANARRVVSAWRERNPWARRYWDGLWEAFLSAMDNPGECYKVGRTSYTYERNYLGGTVFCMLPDGRMLTYPGARWRKIEVENPVTGVIEEKNQLSYRRGYGVAGLWYGKLAENNTQATAASILRHTLAKLAPGGDIIGHTHDEIIGVAPTVRAAELEKEIKSAMLDAPQWLVGCPMAVETTRNSYYTKALD